MSVYFSHRGFCEQCQSLVVRLHVLENSQHPVRQDPLEWFCGWEWVPLQPHKYAAPQQDGAGYLRRFVDAEHPTQNGLNQGPASIVNRRDGKSESVTADHEDIDILNFIQDSGVQEEADPAKPIHATTVDKCEVTVCFNHAYSVPVLYIEQLCSNASGTIPSIIDIERILDVEHTISEAIHPIKNTACFMVNPCRTQDAMRVLQSTTDASPRDKESCNPFFVVRWMNLVCELFKLQCDATVFQKLLATNLPQVVPATHGPQDTESTRSCKHS